MNSNPNLNITKYDVDLQENVIVFHIKEYEGELVGEAVFEGVWGHQFSNILCGNIVASIKKYSPKEFHEKYYQVLEEYQQCGLPFNAFKPDEFSISVVSGLSSQWLLRANMAFLVGFCVRVCV